MNTSSSCVCGGNFGIGNTGFVFCHGVKLVFVVLLLSPGSLIFARCEVTLRVRSCLWR